MRKIVNNEAPQSLPVPKVDALDRWVVRSDSRREDWDTVFAGAGDDLVNKIVGKGIPFQFDFSAPLEDPRWVSNPLSGYKQQNIKWTFYDPVYVKEGTLYFYDMPKGSYMDFYIGVTQGYPYQEKKIDSNLDIIRTVKACTVPYLRFANWLSHFLMEGSAPMGDELNTESSAEYPTYPFHIFEALATVPDVEGWQQAHGHWNLELYRPCTIYFP